MQGQLGLEGIPNKLVRVTPARLAAWSACSRKYRLTYLDRPSTARGGAWAHNTLGAVVHNTLRAFFELPERRRTPEQAGTLLHRYWKSDGFQDARQADEYRRRARQWITDYVAALDADANPIAVERWVSAPEGSIIAEGRVDRIDQRGNELVVVDYKTGRHALSPEDAGNSLALALYALAVRKVLHGRCRRVELHHLPSGRVLGWDHTEESLRQHRSHAEELAQRLQEATDAVSAGADPDPVFPPNPGRHCAWCEVRSHCPEGQRAAPELPSWSLLAGQSKA